jgi:hypothetical protein
MALNPIPIKTRGDRQAQPRTRIKETTTNIRIIVTVKSQGCESITYSSDPVVSEKTTGASLIRLFNHQEETKTCGPAPKTIEVGMKPGG